MRTYRYLQKYPFAGNHIGKDDAVEVGAEP